MTTSMNYITERIAVGGQIARITDLTKVGITHVINCQYEHDDRRFPDASLVQIHWYPQLDDGTPRDRASVLAAVKFGLDALAQPETKVYCHCAAGVNRGPTMGYALLRALGIPSDEAIARIRTARPFVNFYNLTSYLYSVDSALYGPPVRT